MTVHGTGSLRGCTHTIAPDHIEIGSFMALAGVTGGELVVKDTVPEDLRMIRLVFERLGLRSEVRGARRDRPRQPAARIRNDAGDYMPKVEDGPWPAFPADLTSIALALATQAEGSVIIHEKMFENRLFFTDKLSLMGAAITICDPHRAIVVGPAAAARRAGRVAGHPRRDGDADRRAVRRRRRPRSATSARSTAATSGSTSGCASSARGSRGSTTCPSAAD